MSASEVPIFRPASKYQVSKYRPCCITVTLYLSEESIGVSINSFCNQLYFYALVKSNIITAVKNFLITHFYGSKFEKKSLPALLKSWDESEPKLVATNMGCNKSEKQMSESARATMNQWVAFIRFLRTHRTITTIRLATIDTITENHHHNFS